MNSRPILAARLPRRRMLMLAGALSGAALLRRSPVRLAAAQTAPVQRVTLPNGLLVIVEERRTADTVAVQLTARTGARDDGALPGLNLLTSSLMLSGTARRPSNADLLRAAAAVGGTLGGSGQTEVAIFASTMPYQEADLGFDLLADLVTEPLLDPGALDRQQALTLQQIAQRRTNPDALVSDLFQAAMFNGHPAGMPVIGTEASVQAIGPADVAAQHARVWGAANTVLTVVGRISPAEALAKAEQYFGGLPAGTRTERVGVAQPPTPAGETVTGVAGQQQAVFRLGYTVPGLDERTDRYALTVLNAITGGASGRFFDQIRNERGLAYVANSAYLTYSDAGAWFATAGVDPVNVGAALTVVRDEVRRLRESEPDADTMRDRIGLLTGQRILAAEGNAARASQLAAEEILGTDPTETFVERVQAVTAADVQRVAARYLDPDGGLLVLVGPRVE
jgi:predicted Zn-dependent peptidase